MDTLEIVLIGFLGLVLGSFASALIYRIPRGESWVTQRSRCVICGTALTVSDLIPLISWARTRGHCRHCNEPISSTYPVVEAGTALCCLLAYAVLGMQDNLFFIIALIPILFALLVIDLKEMILPNQLVLIAVGIGFVRLLYELFTQSINITDFAVLYVFGAILYAGLAWFLGWVTGLILKRDALGFGDVKFFFAAGLWLGVSNLALFCIVSGTVGVVYAAIWQIVFKQRTFPFGPALITSLYLLLLFEGSLLP